jgi:putative membrane protein insertion efficiency factor
MAAETLNHYTVDYDGEHEHHRFWRSGRRSPVRPSIFSLPVLALIQLYQKTVSKQIQARQCRFNPTCSQYAYDAIAQYGLIVGGLLARNRISRCNPSHPAGNDPVP